MTVIDGDGSLFWNGGMATAWRSARHTRPDAYLWLNDDVVLRPDALARTLRTREQLLARGVGDAILVGSTDDPDTGVLTYGGVVRSAPMTRPLAFEMIQPGPAPVQVETMNGQWVWVPSEIAEQVGNLDHRYGHALGDYDYGLKADRRGIEVWMLPGFVGSCPRNPELDAGSRPLREELKDLTGFRQLPLGDWQIFARRWGRATVAAVLGQPLRASSDPRCWGRAWAPPDAYRTSRRGGARRP